MMTAEPIKRPGFTFTAIDFETANWYRSSACSIGMVRVKDGIIVDRYCSLLKPEPNFFNEINVRIHGITAEQCENAPRFVDLLPEIRHWIDGEVLVAHNASFERSVINGLKGKQDFELTPDKYICTLAASRGELKELELRSHSLNMVYWATYKKTLNHHHALEDAEACAHILMYIQNDTNGPYTLGKLGSSVKIKDLTKDANFKGTHTLENFTFCFTGALSSFSRVDAWQFVIDRSGLVSAGVTQKTTHLVIGGYDPRYGDNFKSNKYTKALEINRSGGDIKIMTEDDFIEFANNK